jgi:DNA ligase-1
VISRFAELVDGLVITRSRNEKLALIADYLKSADPADRGWALAALTGTIEVRHVTSSVVRAMVGERVDETLFRLCREFVGDTAETAALIWPPRPVAQGEPLTLAGVVGALQGASKAAVPGVLSGLMDACDASARFAVLKLALGHFRVGVSERLAKTAFAQAYGLDVDRVEEVWHASRPPHEDLFAWGEGRAGPPDVAGQARLRPFMLAAPLEAIPDDLDAFAVEWKWDGIRVQLACAGGQTRLFSRGGEEISDAFPEFAGTLPEGAAVDGELLIADPDQPYRTAPFSTLQKRLGRKAPTRALLSGSPAFIRLYDLMEADGTDWRERPWGERRAALDALAATLPPARFDVSPLVPVSDAVMLEQVRANPPAEAIEGVMLKRRDSAYTPGRTVGLWFKWKREARLCDCVLMYAQRGSGKRASFYSDYTFGCWDVDGVLKPVGKAYSGFTDAELKRLDSFVRAHTVGRFGPVVEVEKSLVFEVAFDAVSASTRHKSGLAMRFPRIHRIRWDKPAAEADTVATLRNMVGQGADPIAGNDRQGT